MVAKNQKRDALQLENHIAKLGPGFFVAFYGIGDQRSFDSLFSYFRPSIAQDLSYICSHHIRKYRTYLASMVVSSETLD